MSQLNIAVFNYATAVVPQHTDIRDEFEHIKTWAIVNKLVFNLHKTKEIVFKRPRGFAFPYATIS